VCIIAHLLRRTVPDVQANFIGSRSAKVILAPGQRKNPLPFRLVSGRAFEEIIVGLVWALEYYCPLGDLIVAYAEILKEIQKQVWISYLLL